MNEDTFNIMVSITIGDKEAAECLAKLISSHKNDDPINVVSGTLAAFGVIKISEVTYKPHENKETNVGAVVLDLECSDEQRQNNIKAAKEAASE